MNRVCHDDPVKDILEKAVTSYGNDTDELVKFELYAFLFSRIFVQLAKKSKNESASLMIVLVLGIWNCGADKLFAEKRKCASVLMNRNKLFHEAGVENQVRELLFHIKCAKKSGHPEIIEMLPGREAVEVGPADMSLPTEESLAAWIGSLSGIMTRIAGLVKKEATCALPPLQQEKKGKWSFWKWFWLLAGSAALGTVSVICC